MNTKTAWKILKKEASFVGIPLYKLVLDVQKQVYSGNKVYNDEIIEAVRVVSAPF